MMMIIIIMAVSPASRHAVPSYFLLNATMRATRTVASPRRGTTKCTHRQEGLHHVNTGSNNIIIIIIVLYTILGVTLVDLVVRQCTSIAPSRTSQHLAISPLWRYCIITIIIAIYTLNTRLL